jgi:hypothetical protein
MGESLTSIRSDATATPEAPTPPAARPTPPMHATPRGSSPRLSTPRSPKSSSPRTSGASARPAQGAPGASGSWSRRDRHTSAAGNRLAARNVSRQANRAFTPAWRTLLDAPDHVLRKLRRLDPNLFDYAQMWLNDRMPFHWRERARRRVSWRRRTLLIGVLLTGAVLAVILGNAGISVMRQVTQAFANTAAFNLNQPQSTPGSVIIAPAGGPPVSPTPGATAYTVGVWTSNSTPAGGAVTAYVRVSENGAAVAHTRVYLQISAGGPNGGYRVGPYTTDAYGMATIRVRYGAGGGTPVFLTAYATISGQTYTGTYTFVAL